MLPVPLRVVRADAKTIVGVNEDCDLASEVVRGRSIIVTASELQISRRDDDEK